MLKNFDDIPEHKLLKNFDLVKRLPRDNMVQILNQKCCEFFDMETTDTALRVYPELPLHINKSLLTDDSFLEILSCDAFRTFANSPDFLPDLSPEVLTKINLFSNIKMKDGSTADFYQCLGDELTKKLLNNYDLVRRLPRDNFVRILNEKCCEYFDKATTDTALKVHPDLPLYINDR